VREGEGEGSMDTIERNGRIIENPCNIDRKHIAFSVTYKPPLYNAPLQICPPISNCQEDDDDEEKIRIRVSCYVIYILRY
jgi:hypothetical protein